MIGEPLHGRDRLMSKWLIAVILIVVGVLFARLIRAALEPSLKRPPQQFESHWV